MKLTAALAWLLVCEGFLVGGGDKPCGLGRLPKPGETVILSSEHWDLNLGGPCRQARFQLLLTKAIGRGGQSQVYEAQLQQCSAAARDQTQGLNREPATTNSNSASCQYFVNACKLPPSLTEPGRRLALKIRHHGLQIPTHMLQGCNLPEMERIRKMFLNIHTVLSGMSPHASVPTSYLVGDVYAADASANEQQEAGVPAQLQDLVEGQNLWRVQQRLGPVDTHHVISRVLGTLVDLNKQGWVHQDLTLGQIVCKSQLFSLEIQSRLPDGSISNCVVVDFDYLVFLGHATDIPTKEAGWYHRAPEYSQHRVASNSHVWSLGFAMLFLRGALAEKYAAGLRSSRERNAQTLASMRSGPYMHLSQVEWNFIQRCMAYDWKERPTTASLAEDEYIVKGLLSAAWRSSASRG